VAVVAVKLEASRGHPGSTLAQVAVPERWCDTIRSRTGGVDAWIPLARIDNRLVNAAVVGFDEAGLQVGRLHWVHCAPRTSTP
jgi:hypothetical protein